MFSTQFDASFVAHLDLIAGTSSVSPTTSEAGVPSAMPWGCDAPPGTTTNLLHPNRVETAGNGPFPCFTQFATLADTLDDAGLSWKYYAPAFGTARLVVVGVPIDQARISRSVLGEGRHLAADTGAAGCTSRQSRERLMGDSG